MHIRNICIKSPRKSKVDSLPYFCAFDKNTNVLFVSDYNNNCVSRVFVGDQSQTRSPDLKTSPKTSSKTKSNTHSEVLSLQRKTSITTKFESFELSRPTGIFFHDETNQLFVCDSRGHRVCVIDVNEMQPQDCSGADVHLNPNPEPNPKSRKHSKKVFTVTKIIGNEQRNSSHPYYLNYPMGITILNDEIYVCDKGGGKVVVYDLNGHPLRIITTGLVEPAGITSRHKMLYVCDQTSKYIKMFSPDGVYGGTLGGSQQTSKISTLGYPYDCIILPDGKTVVTTENINNRIRVKSLVSKDEIVLGGEGYENLRFVYPRGICYNPNNNHIYVVDTENSRIQEIDIDDVFVSSKIDISLSSNPDGTNNTNYIPKRVRKKIRPSSVLSSIEYTRGISQQPKPHSNQPLSAPKNDDQPHFSSNPKDNSKNNSKDLRNQYKHAVPTLRLSKLGTSSSQINLVYPGSTFTLKPVDQQTSDIDNGFLPNFIDDYDSSSPLNHNGSGKTVDEFIIEQLAAQSQPQSGIGMEMEMGYSTHGDPKISGVNPLNEIRSSSVVQSPRRTGVLHASSSSDCFSPRNNSKTLKSLKNPKTHTKTLGRTQGLGLYAFDLGKTDLMDGYDPKHPKMGMPPKTPRLTLTSQSPRIDTDRFLTYVRRLSELDSFLDILGYIDKNIREIPTSYMDSINTIKFDSYFHPMEDISVEYICGEIDKRNRAIYRMFREWELLPVKKDCLACMLQFIEKIKYTTDLDWLKNYALVFFRNKVKHHGIANLTINEETAVGSNSTTLALYRYGELNSKPIFMKSIFVENEPFWKTELAFCEELVHPNIVQFLNYDFEFDDAISKWKIGLVFERVDRTLHDVVNEWHRTSRQPGFSVVHRILFLIALGLKYIHSKHVIHRDIKTANILIDEHHTPKICDLGLAVRYGYTSDRNPCEGPSEDMAPEILKNGKITNKIDIFNMGGVFASVLWAVPYRNVRRFCLDENPPNEQYGFLVKTMRNPEPSQRPPCDEIISFLKGHDELC